MDQEAVKFGLYVQKHRKAKGYTQQELADMLGITMKSVSYIESGINFPSPQNIFKLAECLDMSLDEYVFSYKRFNETISIQEINEMLDNLSLEDKLFAINILKAVCESLQKRKEHDDL